MQSPLTPEALFARKPYLRACFEPVNSTSIEAATARNGERIVLVQGRSLSSRYNPGAEADRAMDAIRSRLRPERILLLSGLGNPLILDRLLALRAEQQICIAIDHRADLVRWLVRNDPAMQEYLSLPGCHLFSPDMLDSLWSYLAGLPIQGFRGISMVRHPGSLADAPAFYRETEARVQGFLKSALSDLLTRFEFESLWLRNTLLNLRYLPPSVQAGHGEARDGDTNIDGGIAASPVLLSHWKNAWADRPALLVGAGPSLRKSLPLIRSLADRCLILACDTALKPLLRAGIRPQGVHVLDAQPHTLLHLRGEDLSDIVIFADLVVHPHLAEKLGPAKWIFSTTAKYYFDAAGRPVQLQTPGAAMAGTHAGSIGALQSGGSVATSAFDLLRFLGASPILMAGTDLAWTWRQLHCVGTHHYEKWLGSQRRTQPLEHTNEALIQRRVRSAVPGLSGHDVLGDHALDLYRHWFEESIAGLPELPVWNLTADGARIAGARRPASMSDFSVADVSSLPPTASVSPAHVFADAQPLHRSDAPALRAIYARAKQALEDLTEGVSTAEDAFDRLVQEFPEMNALRRRADSYLRRNADRLDASRREAVLRRQGGKELKRLLRWLDGRITGDAAPGE